MTAAATGERWAQGGSRHHFVFCYLGSGVGAGIVMDDLVLRGASNNIGEIGNILVDCDGEDVGIGLPGTLAGTLPAAGPRRPGPASRSARRLGGRTNDFVAVDDAFTELCERAYAGDAGCLGLLDLASSALGSGLAVLVNALDVDRVVLGGPIWSRISSHVLATLAGDDPAAARRGPSAARGRGVGGRRARRRTGRRGAGARPLPVAAAPRCLMMD